MSVNAEPCNRRRSIISYPQRIGIHLWPNGYCCSLHTTITDDLLAIVGTACGVRCTLYRVDQVPTENKLTAKGHISKSCKS